MAIRMHDIFGPGSNVKERVLQDYEDLGTKVRACKQLGLRIVLTSGSFDLFHEGHSRYLEAARQRGDLLIVGVDEDEKVRQKKGRNRPIVTEEHRCEILCHTRHVDLVFLKRLGDPQWQLIKTVRPDVLIATQETYNEQQLVELRQFCGEVIVLPPQSANSTTSRIRLLLMGTAEEVRARLAAAVDDVNKFLDGLHGGRV